MSQEDKSGDGQLETTKSPLLSKSAEGATFLILFQIGSRALTFAANQFLLRYLTPELLGLSNQLEVYSVSVLFFAREALRVAVQRQRDAADDKKEADEGTKTRQRTKQARKLQEAVNLAYISLLLGIFFAVTLAWVYLRSLRSNPVILAVPYFNEALFLYGFAACLELLAEPSFMVIQMRSDYKTRAAAESVATLSRCLVTCAYVTFAARHNVGVGVFPFASGQGVYSVMLLLVYHIRGWKRAAAVSESFSLQIRKITHGYVLENDRNDLIPEPYAVSLEYISCHIFHGRF